MKNEYTARKVSIKDTQPCLVCHKPTTTVLYSGIDWFYTCDIHLRDNPQFVTHLYSKEYQEAVTKLKALKPPAAVNSSSVLDGWITKFLKKDSTEKNRGSDDIDKTTEDKDQRQELQRQYDAQLDLIAKLQQQNRKYQLSRTVFESRIQRKQWENRLREQKRIEDENYTDTDPQELEMKFVFPSVPKS